MNHTTKYVILVTIAIVASVIFLKPIVGHDDEYRVIIVNISEKPISNVTLSGAGANSNKIGPILVGDMQDYYFNATQDEALTYSLTQGSKNFKGTVKASLNKNETGEMYIVMGEMYQIKVYDDYDAAY